jgi:Leucine-rich repeat (LRR) protein
MTGLKWLKLNNTSIDWIPEQLGNLKNMESLSFAKNNLITLHGELSQMPSLKYLNCKSNRLKNSGIPADLFKSKELVILDLSYNQLKEIPPELDQMHGLQVLNLCHNQIESIPNQLFVNITELVMLDLSDNKLGKPSLSLQLQMFFFHFN